MMVLRRSDLEEPLSRYTGHLLLDLGSKEGIRSKHKKGISSLSFCKKHINIFDFLYKLCCFLENHKRHVLKHASNR